MINYIEKGTGLHAAIAAAGHRLTQAREDGSYIWKSTDDLAVQAIIDAFDPLVFERIEAKARVIEGIDVAMSALEKAYPEIEKKTFPKQQIEVEAWENDSLSPTPNIDAIALQRGITREVQLESIKLKTAGYQALANKYTGERQRLFDVIDSESDFTVIQSIKFITLGP